MNTFDESQITRDEAGRFSRRPASAPAASLDEPPPIRAPQIHRGRRPTVHTGVVRKSPVAWKASTELEAMAKATARLTSSETRLRRALIERELARMGVELAGVGINEDDRFYVAYAELVPGRTVDAEQVGEHLNATVPIELPSQTSYAGSGPASTEEALSNGGGEVHGRDEVATAQASFDRSTARVRKQAARTVTALCPEAKQQNVSRISVIEGEVYTPPG